MKFVLDVQNSVGDFEIKRNNSLRNQLDLSRICSFSDQRLFIVKAHRYDLIKVLIIKEFLLAVEDFEWRPTEIFTLSEFSLGS